MNGFERNRQSVEALFNSIDAQMYAGAMDKVKKYAGKQINSQPIEITKIIDDGKNSGFFTFQFKSGNNTYQMTYDYGFGGEKDEPLIKKVVGGEVQSSHKPIKSEVVWENDTYAIGYVDNKYYVSDKIRPWTRLSTYTNLNDAIAYAESDPHQGDEIYYDEELYSSRKPIKSSSKEQLLKSLEELDEYKLPPAMTFSYLSKFAKDNGYDYDTFKNFSVKEWKYLLKGIKSSRKPIKSTRVSDLSETERDRLYEIEKREAEEHYNSLSDSDKQMYRLRYGIKNVRDYIDFFIVHPNRLSEDYEYMIDPKEKLQSSRRPIKSGRPMSEKRKKELNRKKNENFENQAWYERTPGELGSWRVHYIKDYEDRTQYGFHSKEECLDWINENGFILVGE